jgi:hypothetical protein
MDIMNALVRAHGPDRLSSGGRHRCPRITATSDHPVFACRLNTR